MIELYFQIFLLIIKAQSFDELNHKVNNKIIK
jgi:hypothetical protein